MKKICLAICCALVVVPSFMLVPKRQNDYLRIHIRANSNSRIDQSIKYEIKDLVVSFFTPKMQSISTKSQAVQLFNDQKSALNRVIDGFLLENGFDYHAETLIKNELFPTRTYGETTLEEGYYDAIIINLGSGEGDNWWCVVYPPLCFTDEKVTYRSFILDKLFGRG